MGTEKVPFGSLLRRYRVDAGLTQEELAERAQLSPTGVSALERGVRNRPHRVTVDLLIEALGLGPADQRVLIGASRALEMETDPWEMTVPVGGFLGATPESRLIGRDVEAERIRTTLDRVADGRGQVLLLAGETGAGKTRLLQEIMVDSRARGMVVLTGTCYRGCREIEFYPLLDALAGLPTAAPAPIRDQATANVKAVQALMGSRPNGTPTGKVIDRSALFDAISDSLQTVSRVTPLTLLLDDMHWMDDASIQLLQYLARTTRGSRVLLAGSSRDDAIGEDNPQLAEALRILSRQGLLDQLTVRRLSLDETTAFVSDRMGDTVVSEEFAIFVYRRSKGNPRLIDGLIRSLGGRLELQAEIGAGSTGRVFRAIDHGTGRVVAAKLVLARDGIELEDLLRFQQEGAVLAALDHPNIVRIYDTFAEEHAACINMELLEGASLAEVLQEGPLSLSKAKVIALQAISALRYAHSQSVVHRDIKPGNIMVLAEDRVKVTDFGIARLVPPDSPLGTVATTGMRAGTPSYMAPEQIAGKEIDGRADVYALGATLFHMVAGRPPFEGADALSIAVKQLQESPAPPSRTRPDVPNDWDALIIKSLAKDPAKRFQSARSMEEAISKLSEHVAAKSRGNLQPILASVAGLLVAAVVAALLVSQVQAPTAHASVNAKLNHYLSYMAARGRFSGVMLVGKKGRVLFQGARGYANRNRKVKNGPGTVFLLGSGVTTTLSITGIIHEIESFAINWNDSICTYLPIKCGPKWNAITVRSALNGTSDLPDYTSGKSHVLTSQALAACQSKPLKPTRTPDVRYGSCDALVLSMIYASLTNQRTPRPASIAVSASGPTVNVDTRPQPAIGYDGYTRDLARSVDDFIPAYSTARNLFRYDTTLIDGRLLNRKDRSLLLTSRTRVGSPNAAIKGTRWAYGAIIGRIFGRRAVVSFGSQYDFRSVNMHFPGSHMTIVVLTNDRRDNAVKAAIQAACIEFRQRECAHHNRRVKIRIPNRYYPTGSSISYVPTLSNDDYDLTVSRWEGSRSVDMSRSGIQFNDEYSYQLGREGGWSQSGEAWTKAFLPKVLFSVYISYFRSSDLARRAAVDFTSTTRREAFVPMRRSKQIPTVCPNRGSQSVRVFKNEFTAHTAVVACWDGHREVQAVVDYQKAYQEVAWRDLSGQVRWALTHG